MNIKQEVTPEPVASLNLDSAADRIGALLGDADTFDDDAQRPVEGEDQEEETVAKGEEPEVPEVEPEQDAEGDKPEASYSMAELAAAMDMTIDEFLSSVKTTVKVNGKEMEVTLGEAARGYQREEDYSRKTMELAEQRRAVQEASTQAEAFITQLQQIAQQQTGWLDQAENQLMTAFNGEDWNTLRMNDPAEFAARRQEYEQQFAQIQRSKQQTQQQLQYATAQQQAYLQQVVVPQEMQLLREAIPEWKDEAVAAAERKELAKYLIETGKYQPEEINALMDHRAAVIARKAMLWDRSQQKTQGVREKVREIPSLKNLKPGRQLSKAQQVQQRRTESLKKLRKTGSIHDAVAAMPDFD